MHLAIFLYDIAPHAATVKRPFSLMGWYHSARRNRLGVDSTGSMSAIKTFYEQKPTRCALSICCPIAKPPMRPVHVLLAILELVC